MKKPRKIERSEDQVQVSISLPRQLLEALEEAALEHTRGNRSKLVATVLTGVLRTEKMAEMVKQGQAPQPLTQTELAKLAFQMIAKDDPNTAKVLSKRHAGYRWTDGYQERQEASDLTFMMRL